MDADFSKKKYSTTVPKAARIVQIAKIRYSGEDYTSKWPLIMQASQTIIDQHTVDTP